MARLFPRLFEFQSFAKWPFTRGGFVIVRTLFGIVESRWTVTPISTVIRPLSGEGDNARFAFKRDRTRQFRKAAAEQQTCGARCNFERILVARNKPTYGRRAGYRVSSFRGVMARNSADVSGRICRSRRFARRIVYFSSIPLSAN